MNFSDFQKRYSTELKNFLETDAGKSMIATLSGLRPRLIAQTSEHETAVRFGQASGYEVCIGNILLLASPIPPKKPDPEADYGVTKKIEDKQESDKPKE
jgi:hypothetical protein